MDEREIAFEYLKHELSRFQIRPISIFRLKREVIVNSKTSWDSEAAKLAPTFAFIDPFGFAGIVWSEFTKP